MAIGEANGKSSTFTIKQQSATQTDCVGPYKKRHGARMAPWVCDKGTMPPCDVLRVRLSKHKQNGGPKVAGE